MRKFPLVILIAVSAALGSMIFIHRQSMEQHSRKQSRIELLQQRQGALRDMSVSLEKYRRMSANFRKMTPVEMDIAKDQLRKSMKTGLAHMEQLDPSSEEIGSMDRISRNLDEMFGFAEKFERTAYNKDAYQKAEMVSYHEGVENALKRLGASTESRIATLEQDTSDAADRGMPILISLAGLIVLLWGVGWAVPFWTEERPLRRLYAFSEALRSGAVDLTKVKALPGIYGDIQSSLVQLTQMVQGHARERHKFILDVVSDLRSPLTMVSAGKHLLGHSEEGRIEGAEELQAIDSVKRGLAMLSGSLEDMDDIVEYSRLDSKLEENLVDLSEMIADVARSLNAGPGLEKQITTTVPPMPIWMRVDARRFERVMYQVITKVASTLRGGTGIHITVNQPTHGAFRGVEILVQDVERARDQSGRVQGSGPDLDVLKHWISEKGLGMTLAHRVIKAQGGNLTASGVNGTSVQISVRMPQERLAQVGLISAPRDLELSYGLLRQVESTEEASATEGETANS